MIVLRPRETAAVGMEAGAIRPDLWQTLSVEQIGALPLALGRRTYPLRDLFAIEGQPDDQIVVEGGAVSLAGLGAEMAGGRLVVRGGVGARVGAGMRGGEVEVEGDAGPCAGLAMRGGLLRITGNAGPRAGGAWPGERAGMRGGRLVVEGSAGERLGERMRRGVIVCHGPAGAEAALEMRGGTLVALDALGPWFGAGMNRGTLVALGGAVPLWGAFRYDCLYDPVVVRLLLRTVGLPPAPAEGGYRRYHGDVAALGKGEILVWEARA